VAHHQNEDCERSNHFEGEGDLPAGIQGFEMCDIFMINELWMCEQDELESSEVIRRMNGSVFGSSSSSGGRELRISPLKKSTKKLKRRREGKPHQQQSSSIQSLNDEESNPGQLFFSLRFVVENKFIDQLDRKEKRNNKRQKKKNQRNSSNNQKSNKMKKGILGLRKKK